MIRRADITVSDSLGTPEPGVYITVKNSLGALATIYDDSGIAMANPFTSGTGGAFAYNISDTDQGAYTEEYRLSLSEGPRKTIAVDLSIGGAAAVRNAATRTALVALSTALPAYLTELGREGSFVHYTVAQYLAATGLSLAAAIAADPNQGVFVATATGAWVRKFSGAHNPKWFGATGDGVATGDGAALAAMQSYLNKAALGFVAYIGSGAGKGTSENRIGQGYYLLNSTTLDITQTTRIAGENTGESGGPTTTLKQAANADAIRLQRYNTTGATANLGAGPYTYPGGDASIIQGLDIEGGFTATEGEFMGVRARARLSLRDTTINGFQGDGVYAHATGATDGNTNNAEFYRVYATANRRGFYCTSNDTNAMSFINCSAIGNRQCGFHDNSFIENVYFNCHSASNGYFGDGSAGAPAIGCSYSGKLYGVKVGQEVGASTNAPSGTTADNTWWNYWVAGGPTTGYPAWVSGKTFRAGGGFITEGNASTTILACYQEGDQPPAQFGQNTLIVGGAWGSGLRGGGYIFANANRVGVNSLFVSDGTTTWFEATPNALNCYVGNFTIQSATATALQFFKVNGGTNIAQFYATAAGMHLYAYAGLPITIEPFGALTATFDNTGENLAAGMVHKINGQQVVGARDTGWTADTGTAKKTATATYAPGANLTYSAAYVQAEQTATSTRLQAIEPALRDATQEIKALKDALIAHGMIGA